MGASKSFSPSVVAIIAIFASIIIGYFNVRVEESLTNIENSISIDGIEFPATMKTLGTRQIFVGGGTRVKWTFKVYSVGIYSDVKAVRSLKKKHAGENYESILSDPESKLFRDFSESKSAKTLLLKFRRGVAPTDISDALGEALKPKIGDEDANAFRDFIVDMIGDRKVEKGSKIQIACKGDKLSASLSGESDSTSIGLKKICSAVFGVYLGDNPVSPQAKEGFAKGFASMEL